MQKQQTEHLQKQLQRRWATRPALGDTESGQAALSEDVGAERCCEPAELKSKQLRIDDKNQNKMT